MLTVSSEVKNVCAHRSPAPIRIPACTAWIKYGRFSNVLWYDLATAVKYRRECATSHLLYECKMVFCNIDDMSLVSLNVAIIMNTGFRKENTFNFGFRYKLFEQKSFYMSTEHL